MEIEEEIGNYFTESLQLKSYVKKFFDYLEKSEWKNDDKFYPITIEWEGEPHELRMFLLKMKKASVHYSQMNILQKPLKQQKVEFGDEPDFYKKALLHLIEETREIKHYIKEFFNYVKFHGVKIKCDPSLKENFEKLLLDMKNSANQEYEDNDRLLKYGLRRSKI